jgi:1-acyl-sn-glycerol-3-phosphate acyltransferase
MYYFGDFKSSLHYVFLKFISQFKSDTKILIFLRSIYLVLLFLLFFPSFVIITYSFKFFGKYIKDEKKYEILTSFSKLILDCMSWINIECTGLYFDVKSNINDRGVIYVSNHVSYIDFFFIGYFLAKAKKKIIIRGVMDDYFRKIPIFGTTVDQMKVITIKFVDRNSTTNKASVQDFYRKCEEHLKIGENILIFPEGTTNENPTKLNEIKLGTFKIHEKTGNKIRIFSIKGLNLYKRFFPIYAMNVKIHLYKDLYEFDSVQKYKETLEDKLSYSNNIKHNG